MTNFNAVAIFRGLTTLFMYNNLIIKDFRNQLLLNTFQRNGSHLEHLSNFSSKIDNSQNLKFDEDGVITYLKSNNQENTKLEEYEEKSGINCKKLLENYYNSRIEVNSWDWEKVDVIKK